MEKVNKIGRGYSSGREKVKLYHYDLNGKRLRTFESMAEVRDKYYEGKKQPLFVNIDYKVVQLLPDATCITKEPIGREKLRPLIARFDASFLVHKNQKYEPIEILNFDRVVVAEFYNMTVASKMMGMTQAALYKIATKKTDEMPSNKYKIYVRWKK